MKRLALTMTTMTALALAAGAGWKTETSFDAGVTPELRGFGACEVSHVTYADGDRRVTETVFEATSPSNAETVAGKFLYDLGRGAGVTFENGVFSVPGGAFAVARQGSVTRLASAADAATLRDWAASEPGLAESLVGKADFDAGEDFSVTLSPLMARIRLKELSCDFRGTAYQFEELTDARVYLTNVNADCRVTGETGGSRFINNGGWNESDAVKFSSPEILCREIEGNVGMDFRELNLDLYCYPNPVGEESFGQPFTRLVIEGFVKGHRWYWPISINGLGEGGIRPNESYSLKVCLRRSGTEDPDFAIRLEKDELVMEVEKWDEKENYAVAF